MALALFSERVLIEGKLVPASILIANEKIVCVEEGFFKFPDTELRNCGSDVIFPGLHAGHGVC